MFVRAGTVATGNAHEPHASGAFDNGEGVGLRFLLPSPGPAATSVADPVP